jgi:hypothetical protein
MSKREGDGRSFFHPCVCVRAEYYSMIYSSKSFFSSLSLLSYWCRSQKATKSWHGQITAARPTENISAFFRDFLLYCETHTHTKHKEIPFKSFVSLNFFIYCVTWRDITLSNGIYIHTIEAASAHCCPWRFICRELTGKKETFRVVWTKRGGLTDDREKSRSGMEI